MTVILTAAGCGSTGSSTAGTTETQSTDAAEETSSLPHIYLRLGETDDRLSYEIALLDNEVSERFIRILQDSTRVILLYVFDGSEHTDVLKGFSGQSGDIVIPVYVGGTLFDEAVVSAWARMNLKSEGGKYGVCIVSEI